MHDRQFIQKKRIGRIEKKNSVPDGDALLCAATYIELAGRQSIPIGRD